MEIYRSTIPPKGRYYVQIGNRIYRSWGKGDIVNWSSPKFFKYLISSGKIELMINPPVEIMDEFEEFRTKLILGVVNEDI